MTKELVEVVQAEVTQADREAAADQTVEGCRTQDNMREGHSDKHPLVQAFARHRLSAEAAIVAWLREQSAKAETEGRSIALWEAADTLEQGKIRHG